MPDVIFNGPAGRIEGHFHPGQTKSSPIALLLHPDPKSGGNMNNKIVYALYRAFVDKGFGALRINFRGVGRSEGSFDNGEGELSDAASALDWLQTTYPLADNFWVGGFSFGAWISMQLLMRRPELEGFIVVSPPANKYDFNFLAPCPVSGQIIQGTQDTIVPQPAVDALVTKLRNQRGIKIDYQLLNGADHFFENRIPDIAKCASAYIKHRFTQTPQRFTQAG